MTNRMKQVPHNVFYEMENEDKIKYQEYIKKKIIREKAKKPLFFKMMNIVDEKVEHYHSDFYVHDYNAFTIELLEGGRFIWNVYDCGSRLVSLDNNFVENMNSSIDYFKMLAKNYFRDNTRTFLVDIKEEKLTEINPEKIDESYFSHRYGSIPNYFNEQSKKSGNANFFEWKESFDKLMYEYRNHPPKEKIDEIFKTNKNRMVV